MSNLLIIENKLFKDSIVTICKKKNCEIVLLKDNLLEILAKKKGKLKKIILISQYILSRNSIVYKTIKDFIKNKGVFFIEIGYSKSNISSVKACSDAIINGSDINTENILKKLLAENV